MEKHIDALTGARGVAVLIVFLAHLQQRYFNYAFLDGNVISAAAYFGITIFFVLSGFVIHWNYGILFETKRPLVAGWTFFVARFSRLWPLHFAVSVVALVGWPDLFLFLQHLFMVQLWVFQGAPNISYFNTWSISSEWLFYFVYAAVYPLIAMGMKIVSIWLLPVIVAVAFAIYWLAGPTVQQDDMWLRYFAPYLRLLEFVTGVAAAQIVMTRRRLHQPATSDIAWFCVLLFTVVLYDTKLGQLTVINYLVAPLVAVTLIVVSNRRSFASGWLSARWLMWVGDRSYSIYLLEAVFLVFSLRFENRFDFNLAAKSFTWLGFVEGSFVSFATLALVLRASDLCWRYFEMPARRWIKRSLDLEFRQREAG